MTIRAEFEKNYRAAFDEARTKMVEAMSLVREAVDELSRLEKGAANYDFSRAGDKFDAKIDLNEMPNYLATRIANVLEAKEISSYRDLVRYIEQNKGFRHMRSFGKVSKAFLLTHLKEAGIDVSSLVSPQEIKKVEQVRDNYKGRR